jgi:hypothetical protein
MAKRKSPKLDAPDVVSTQTGAQVRGGSLSDEALAALGVRGFATSQTEAAVVDEDGERINPIDQYEGGDRSRGAK